MDLCVNLTSLYTGLALRDAEERLGCLSELAKVVEDTGTENVREKAVTGLLLQAYAAVRERRFIDDDHWVGPLDERLKPRPSYEYGVMCMGAKEYELADEYFLWHFADHNVESCNFPALSCGEWGKLGDLARGLGTRNLRPVPVWAFALKYLKVTTAEQTALARLVWIWVVIYDTQPNDFDPHDDKSDVDEEGYSWGSWKCGRVCEWVGQILTVYWGLTDAIAACEFTHKYAKHKNCTVRVWNDGQKMMEGLGLISARVSPTCARRWMRDEEMVWNRHVHRIAFLEKDERVSMVGQMINEILGTLLLGLQRLETTGVLQAAHHSMLEDMFEVTHGDLCCW